MAVFVTSDLHFNHDKDFVWKARGFNDVNHMNEEIIKRWNNVVSAEDEVYVLGDIAMSGEHEKNARLINRLNGKIYWVGGNHDSENRIKFFVSACDNLTFLGYSIPFKYKKHTFLFSHYPTLTDNNDDAYGKPLSCRTMNVCGHAHTTNKWVDWDKGLIYHAEIDAHNCTPVNMDKVLEDFKNKFNNKENV